MMDTPEIAPQAGGSYMRDAAGALTKIDESGVTDSVSVAEPVAEASPEPALTTNTQESSHVTL